ncbi:Coiled-coil domain-containing protein 134-like Protein [Gryllus bimaculatus]|nr:Coiled-coil domain-containing protein 134-like Protein [Gryllus bimaculatus]
MEKIQLLLQDVSNQILLELLHSCVDDICERKRQYHYDNFKSCTNWSNDEYDILHTYFKTSIHEILKNPSSEQILKQCPGLSSDHVQCVLDCVVVRKIDVENLLLCKSFAVSGPKLQDFDWKLKWVMGSSALSSVREPLLLLDFMLHEDGVGGKNLNSCQAQELPTRPQAKHFLKRAPEELNSAIKAIKNGKKLLILFNHIFWFIKTHILNLKVIQNSRVLLESSGYAAGISSFPRDETVLDALANILENTALFADIMLHLPDISQKVLAANYEWQVLFQWSISFANQTQLLDKQTVKLLHLANMELNATERDPDYENPYRKKEEKHQFQHEQKISSKKRKKVKKRGPRLSVECESCTNILYVEMNENICEGTTCPKSTTISSKLKLNTA